MRVYVESRKITHIEAEKTVKVGEMVFDAQPDGSFYGRVYQNDGHDMVGGRFTLAELADWFRTKPQGGTEACSISSGN